MNDKSTASLRSCEYSFYNESFDDKIHYITIILSLNYINKKIVLSIKENQKYSDFKSRNG